MSLKTHLTRLSVTLLWRAALRRSGRDAGDHSRTTDPGRRSFRPQTRGRKTRLSAYDEVLQPTVATKALTRAWQIRFETRLSFATVQRDLRQSLRYE